MFIIVVLLTEIVINVNGLPLIPTQDLQKSTRIQKPYFFNYDIKSEENAAGSSRCESSDDHGRTEGFYEIQNDEGHYRIVKYTADENGFRVTIQSNEPGTGNQNPAHVTIHSKVDSPVLQDQALQNNAFGSNSLEFVPESGRVGTFLPKGAFRATPV